VFGFDVLVRPNLFLQPGDPIEPPVDGFEGPGLDAGEVPFGPDLGPFGDGWPGLFDLGRRRPAVWPPPGRIPRPRR